VEQDHEGPVALAVLDTAARHAPRQVAPSDDKLGHTLESD
jgi:hypothetical protein